MDNSLNSSYLVVIDSRVIPDVFVKVLEVKKTIANREARSLAAACKQSGISRSAYYKYKDYVFLYEEQHTQRVVTLYAVLKDRPGVLANVLSAVHSSDANVLTLNQSVPVDGVAPITMTLKLSSGDYNEDNLKSSVRKVDGVVDVRVLNRE